MHKTLIAKPLTDQDFEAYGEVIAITDNKPHFPINNGLTTRYHDLAQTMAVDGKVGISLFASSKIEPPFLVEKMERHPLGSQAFYPLSGQPYLILTAPAGEFNPNLIECFKVNANQGVNYRAGTWHHYCTSLYQDQQFLVVDRVGEGKNLDEVHLRDFDLELQITI